MAPLTQALPPILKSVSSSTDLLLRLFVTETSSAIMASGLMLLDQLG